MKIDLLALAFALTLLGTAGAAASDVVFAEKNGVIAAEAEHFAMQTETGKRAFHLTYPGSDSTITPDGDPSHHADASGGAYLEILPDTRRTHGDKLIKGTNFSPEPGKMAVVTYRTHFSKPGRYYVWVRAYSTGSEDNGLHVGLDGQWPESGQRLQWCEGKNTWRWESKQRTDANHCGEPHKIYLDIDEPGEHMISFSMREDGFEFDKWFMTMDRDFARPTDAGPKPFVHRGELPAAFVVTPGSVAPRGPDGDGSVNVSGDLKMWHKVTLDLNGPYAQETDESPNPFTDYRMTVRFDHSSGKSYTVPGYFAADGNSGNSSAEQGTTWRAHFAPDEEGVWTYSISFHRGSNVALLIDSDSMASAKVLPNYDGKTGVISIAKSDKAGRDFRGQGRLEYVGKHYLQFAQSKKYFLKVGADAPETLLAFADFDNTIAGNPKKAPLKSWDAHVKDWTQSDPTWQNGKGKGLIGAINYLSGKGCNAFSFLTYNAGGDGDNVWPFVQRDDKFHYDCSKLDQWAIVFEHGTKRGMYLHFKMQETENDDNSRGHKKSPNSTVKESLDGGELGRQRKLYCRELIARFGHNLALNWNLGEENTQTAEQQKAMIDYIAELDVYDHPIVIHTFPDQQDKVYNALLGDQSQLTGTSLQNSGLAPTHSQTVKWVNKSGAAGKPWVVAFDESGSAAHAQCPDLGYNGFDGHDHSGEMTYTQHLVRKQTLWGVLMGGGAGCEYYFGYKFDQNDIVCEDWRSRDQSWDYCRIAIGFFHDNAIPFWEMQNADDLIGNPQHAASNFCFAKSGSVYLVYLPNGGTHDLDLTGVDGTFSLQWFNPRDGGELQQGSVTQVSGGSKVSLGAAPADADEDWLAVLRGVTEK